MQGRASRNALDVSQKPFCVRIIKKMPGPRSPRRLCSNLRSRNALARAPVGARMYRENATDQGRWRHLVRAGAVEMHMDVAQKPFYANLQVKCGRPRPRHRKLCEAASSKCIWTFHKSHFAQKITGKMPQTKTAEDTLCEPWQSKCTWTFCKSSLLCENWQVKCCRPRPLTKLCAEEPFCVKIFK